MSQVIVEDDNLRVKRQNTRKQEIAIDRESIYQRWRLPDVKKTRPILQLIGIAVLPVVLFWTLLMGAMSLVLGFCLGLFRVLGLVRKKQPS